MEYGKAFKSLNTCTTKIHYNENNFDFLKMISLSYKEYKISYYEIIFFRLLSCPSVEEINDIYENCQNDLGSMLNVISGNKPIRTIHFLVTLLEYINDKYYILLKIGDYKLKHILSHGCSIRLNPSDVDYYDYNENKKFALDRFKEWGEINFSNNTCLFWIKETNYTELPQNTMDSRIVLKEILNDLYDSKTASKMSSSINGTIGNTNGQNKNVDRNTLYNLLKNKFSSVAKYDNFVSHHKFDLFLSNRITEMISRR